MDTGDASKALSCDVVLETPDEEGGGGASELNGRMLRCFFEQSLDVGV